MDMELLWKVERKAAYLKCLSRDLLDKVRES